jgi:hypothetical protein
MTPTWKCVLQIRAGVFLLRHAEKFQLLLPGGLTGHFPVIITSFTVLGESIDHTRQKVDPRCPAPREVSL